MIESSGKIGRGLPYRFTSSTDIMHTKLNSPKSSASYEHFRVNFVKLYDQYQRGEDSIRDAFPAEDGDLAEKLATLQMIDFETIPDDGRGGNQTPEPFMPRRQSTTLARMSARKPIVRMTKSKIAELSKRFTSKFRISSSPLNSPPRKDHHFR